MTLRTLRPLLALDAAMSKLAPAFPPPVVVATSARLAEARRLIADDGVLVIDALLQTSTQKSEEAIGNELSLVAHSVGREIGMAIHEVKDRRLILVAFDRAIQRAEGLEAAGYPEQYPLAMPTAGLARPTRWGLVCRLMKHRWEWEDGGSTGHVICTRCRVAHPND